VAGAELHAGRIAATAWGELSALHSACAIRAVLISESYQIVEWHSARCYPSSPPQYRFIPSLAALRGSPPAFFGLDSGPARGHQTLKAQAQGRHVARQRHLHRLRVSFPFSSARATRVVLWRVPLGLPELPGQNVRWRAIRGDQAL
jgi:hypothetical protein